jgi:PIN domain nuclease of toxin-antitoxin system
MKLLLNTHIFIWWISTPERLSPRVLALCEDRANELILSVAGVWEMQIKLQRGKLQLALPLRDLVASQRQADSMVLLPVAPTHVLALQSLPTPHNDPFGRILVAQAIAEEVTLLSQDAVFARYPVTVLGEADRRSRPIASPIPS